MHRICHFYLHLPVGYVCWTDITLGGKLCAWTSYDRRHPGVNWRTTPVAPVWVARNPNVSCQAARL